MEYINEGLTAQLCVFLFVRISKLLDHQLACLADIGIQHIGGLVELKPVHKPFVIQNGFFCSLQHRCGNLSHRHDSIVVFLGGVDAGTDDPVEYVGEQEAVL